MIKLIKMANPLVSVIVTTKNSEMFLGKCLDSIKNQEYQNIEIIVVDNNSFDRTKVIAKEFTNKVYNIGPERSAQRNFGANQARSDYLIIIDSDMVLSNKVIGSCIKKMQENNNIKGIKIPEESIGKGFWAQCKKLEKSFYIGVDWMEAARFFDKTTFMKAGGFNESMTSGEDWDLSQRVEKYGKIERIKDIIYHNEGKINLFSGVKKKSYYAGKFTNYATNNKDSAWFKKQTGILNRYKLFFSQPKRLLKNPIIGFGMLFLKTCEFGFGGLYYLINRFIKKNPS